MSSVTLSANSDFHPQMRQMNIFRDMPQVADLIELCFSDTMDHEGRRTLSDMRRAGREADFGACRGRFKGGV